MKKFVKTLVFLTIASLLTFSVSAQLKLPGSNATGNDIKKVIEDYPNRFIHLMGEVVVQNPQSIDYQCNFRVHGAEEATITRYTSKKDICSWQAVMLTTESFEKAKQKFKSLFNQLNNLSINASGAGARKLKGEYLSLTEERKFTSVLFNVDPADEKMKKLKVEISMRFVAPMEWKIIVTCL